MLFFISILSLSCHVFCSQIFRICVCVYERVSNNQISTHTHTVRSGVDHNILNILISLLRMPLPWFVMSCANTQQKKKYFWCFFLHPILWIFAYNLLVVVRLCCNIHANTHPNEQKNRIKKTTMRRDSFFERFSFRLFLTVALLFVRKSVENG